MPKKRRKRKRDLKGIKAPNNKGIPYLPSHKTLERKALRYSDRWARMKHSTRYPTGLAQLEHDNEQEANKKNN